MTSAAPVGTDAPPLDTFHMGPGTLGVSRSQLHGKLRGRALERLRAVLPADKHGVVYLQGGKGIPLYTSDMELLFKQEPFFHYLFGVQEEDWHGALCVKTGRSVLFMPRLPESYAVWMGPLKKPEDFRAKYAVDAVHYVDEMPAVLAGMAPACLHVLRGTNTDSGLSLEPPPPPVEGVPLESDTLYNVLTECRVRKTSEEVEVIRYANRIGSEGHVAMMRACRPGQMEYHLEAAFLSTCYATGGCRSPMYTPIAASGPNAAVLHYGHAAAPNDRQMSAGDLVLLDCGCEYYKYGSDITTTFPVGGKFSPQQRAVYEAVLAAQRAVLGGMRPGVAWPSLHELAYRRILEGLHAAGVLAGGSVDDYLAADLGGLFMPHGLGHFLGLDTHDVGGYAPHAPARPARPGFSRLRTARALEEGMVITVEPGCYFNPVLLLPALENPAQSRYLVRDAVLAHLSMGGVRLEDNVVVTADGCESLTHVPRDVADVEAVMAGGEWPTKKA